MKILILCIILAIPNAILGQTRVGQTYSKSINEFKQDKYPTKHIEIDDEIFGLNVQMEDYSLDLIFETSDSLVHMVIINPYSRKIMYELIEIFNETYLSIDSKSWKSFSQKGTDFIELKFDKEERGYFKMYKIND